jgi:carbohydrate-selective porin OprB
MLGDWNGQRTALQAQGYDFSFDIPVNLQVF